MSNISEMIWTKTIPKLFLILFYATKNLRCPSWRKFHKASFRVETHILARIQ